MSGFQLDTSGVVRVPLPFKVAYTSYIGSPTFNPRTGETRYRNTRHFLTEAEALAFCGGRKSRVKRATGGAAEAHKPFAWSDLTPFAQGYTAPILEAVNAPFHCLAPATLSRIIEDCERAVRTATARKTVARADSAVNGAWHWAMQQTGGGKWADEQAGEVFPPLTVTLGDDGLIYFREA